MKRLSVQEHRDGELLLYQLERGDGYVYPFWYYAIKIASQKTLKDKSTKRTEFADALMFADTQYQKLKERAMMGISISAVSYQQVFRQAVSYYEAKVKADLLDEVRFHRFKAVNTRAYSVF